MTLNHFKINFPITYKEYLNSKDALLKQKPVVNRIRAFLYHRGMEIILTHDENELYYFPTIKFMDDRPEKRFAEYQMKSLDKALSYGVESAIAYLETGFYN